MADGDPSPSPAAPPPGSPATPAAPQGAGASPAAMPVPNRGLQAAGLPKIAMIIKLIDAARVSFPPGSEQWTALGKAGETLAKHVGPGDVSQGTMTTEMQRLQQQQRASAANTALMRGMQGGGQTGGGAPPPQPMPAA